MILLGSLLSGIVCFGGYAAYASGSVTLYTPYTKISVSPGESIDYAIDVINKSSAICNVEIVLTGLPKGWDYTLKSGGWNVSELSVLPDEKKNVSLKLEVPLKIDKGAYRFNVVAKGLYTLPLTVVVSEQGTFKTEFSCKQPNMEGHANSTFAFSADLKNRTPEKQLYSLRAQAPRGWKVIFKANYKQATSVNVEANASENISIEVDPSDYAEAGTYKIPVQAVTSTTSAEIELEVVITGSYAMELVTPSGLLSASITAGDEKKIDLRVRNTGSAELNDIQLSHAAPSGWEVTFDPKKIDKLDAGKTASVTATVKADKNAIAGDYVTNFEARTPEVSSKVSFRIAVKTPVLMGWIGVLIVFVALGSVFHLFRKYGRR